MLVSDFDFELPDDLIAQEPRPRGTSRMLVLERESGTVRHSSVSHIAQFLRAGDLLVVNNTRVIPARLIGHRVPTGGAVECLLLTRPVERSDGSAHCEALMHPGQKLKPGAIVRFEGPAGVLMCEVLERKFFGRRAIRLWAPSKSDVNTLIDRLGHVPLPPYIRRADTVHDREQYQTVFASVQGSVAAPTAGLHFTADLVRALEEHGVGRTEITLHVGYGTFKPVRAQLVEDHALDPEQYEIPPAAAAKINAARAERRRVIAVGTTTTRALEDAARRGSLGVAAGHAEATTFIYPGFRFNIVDGLLTNFHLPRSSLLMLVCAFAGRERVLTAYREAIAQRYRFYSYGDAMLVV